MAGLRHSGTLLRQALNRTARSSTTDGTILSSSPAWTLAKQAVIHQDGATCACASCCRSFGLPEQLEVLSSPHSCRHGAGGHCPACSQHQASTTRGHDWSRTAHMRHFASGAGPADKAPNGGGKEAQAEASKEEEATAQPEGEQPEELSAEQLKEELEKKKAEAAQLGAQVDKLTDQLKRSLAEMENVRMRSARDVDNAKKFAVQGFVKSILDVGDNLERAAGAVPASALSEDEGAAVDAAQLRKLLKGLLEGVSATEKVLLHVFKQNGLEMYNPLGQKFDPNLHNALFEIPDPSKEVGTIAAVSKRGYKLHDRVIRPADVGVVRAP